ncbi:MAG: class I SAM-dependent methyltransferase [Roseiflexaceae bacterium]|nr:class I SAM-dependent methyltransferase [Roseiflexaceae bacterium]
MDDPQNTPDSIRAAYQQQGVAGFYAAEGDSYRNPHEPAIRRLLRQITADWSLDLGRVLDLACGSGEATLALRELGAGKIDGIDPYTFRAYAARTGQQAEALTFEQIAAGALDGRAYSLIVCSFALHLVEVSRLPLLCYQLAQLSPALLVITPHKRPELRSEWGWQLREETVSERVRARLYEHGAVAEADPWR